MRLYKLHDFTHEQDGLPAASPSISPQQQRPKHFLLLLGQSVYIIAIFTSILRHIT
jgi:hypothetical protein